MVNLVWSEWLRESEGFVREQEFWSPIKGPCSWTKNQIDMRQINRGKKSNLIAYVRGIHTDMEISKTARQNKVCMSS